MNSYFDGSVFGLLGQRLLAALISAITFGFGTPYALCRLYRYEMSHTVIDGRRQYFTGKAGDLFIHWLKWWLLTVITLGIYGIWVQLRWKQWVVEHTHMEPAA